MIEIQESTYEIFPFLNLFSVFLLGALYSFIEIINTFGTARNFFKNVWGSCYVLLNGLISLLALLIVFPNEISDGFVGTKIILAGTSALALLRVISIPVKFGNAQSNAVPMIEIILNLIKTEYDRNKSKEDLKLIKPLMSNIDPIKFSQEIPKLCGNMLNTLSEEDGKRMIEEIQTFLSIKDGDKELKSVNLGFILVKYVGYDLLKVAVDTTKDYITVNNQDEPEETGEDIDSLINKFE